MQRQFTTVAILRIIEVGKQLFPNMACLQLGAAFLRLILNFINRIILLLSTGLQRLLRTLCILVRFTSTARSEWGRGILLGLRRILQRRTLRLLNCGGGWTIGRRAPKVLYNPKVNQQNLIESMWLKTEPKPCGSCASQFSSSKFLGKAGLGSWNTASNSKVRLRNLQ